MGKNDKLLKALQQQEKKMKSVKPVKVNKSLVKEAAETVKNVGAFKKQAALMDKQLNELGAPVLKN